MIYKYNTYKFLSYVGYRKKQSKISGKSREKIGRKYNKAKTYKKSVWIKITTSSNDAFQSCYDLFQVNRLMQT